MKITVLLLCLVSSSVWAGEWFKSAEISFGVGKQNYICNHESCMNGRIGPDPIGKYSISQSIYSTENLKFVIEYNHYSSIPEEKYESPVGYYGLGLSYKHDWY